MDKFQQETLDSTGRRKLLVNSAAVAATVFATSGFAAEQEHHHESSINTDLVKTALDCVASGEACKSHCIKLVKGGDNSIAECLAIVDQMLPMCSALATLASAESPHLHAFAQVCADVCKDCEKECEVHADKHAECKACMESCAACIKECEKLAA